MTTAAPEKPKDKKDAKGPQAGQTGTLPLKGGKDGVTKGLDNKTVIAAPPDPKVVKAAEEHALRLEAAGKAADRANESGQDLLKAFQESKKARKVRIITDGGTYYFSPESLTKLKVERKKSVQR